MGFNSAFKGVTFCFIVSLRRFVLDLIAKASHAEASALCKVFGKLRTIKNTSADSHLFIVFVAVRR
jgi:hypothetical protein